MTCHPLEPVRRARPPAPPATGLTVYGCGDHEASLFRELAPRFGVRLTITDAPVSEVNVDLASGNSCVSVGHGAHVDRATMRALARAGVRHLSTRSVGSDHLDVDHAHSLGISVAPVAYSPDSVADYTVLLILMLLRDARSMLRRSDLLDYRLGRPGTEVRDLTVGVVGTGRIGTAVATRLRGFGCRTITHDRQRGGRVDRVPLDRLLSHSDVVTLHVPLTSQTHHLLDEDRIARLKPGAYVVNTGRGALLDTRALVAALESGRLRGAALDVLEGEEGTFYTDHRDRPVDPLLSRLQALPNVVISPHRAYCTEHALRDIVQHTLALCVGSRSAARHA
jgi:D-specific alpha-keto acid dehydrogenase